MISNNGIAIKFLVLVFVSLSLCMVVSGEMKVRCLEREREALLSFKSGLTDEDGFLSSWGSDEECCKWYGVVCSNTTGNVIGLQLGTYHFDGVLGGKITSSLLELHHLYYLDLSWNDFGGDPIPEFIGSMKQLQHLYLWDSNFSGIVPPQIGNLTNLRSLDLSFNSLRTTQSLDWLSNLSLLSFLDLSRLDLSHTNMNLQHILSSLGSLQKLHLQSCSINDLKPPSAEQLSVNSSHTSLSILGLSENNLTSSALDWLSNFSTSLVEIDLSKNALAGPIPINAFDRLTLVEHLDLSSNMLEGEIPKSLSNLSHLRVLVLYQNDLRGDFDEFVGNISSKGISASLEVLDLTQNQLTGSVPDLRGFSALTEVYLDYNKLTGSVPLSLGQLSQLHALDISNNYLEGTVSESHLNNLENLKILDLSFNSLTLHIVPEWTPPFQLNELLLARCNMGPNFPKWIQSQGNIRGLDLSSAGIIDEMPEWLWGLSPSLEYLSLAYNQIRGTIPDLLSVPIEALDVSFNKISGPIPLFHPITQSFQLNQNMFSGSISSICKTPHNRLLLLDLSSNQLAGEVPNCWEKMPILASLNLGNNSFSGEVPRSLGFLHDLVALQLNDNNLSSELPSTLKNCQNMRLIDVGGNELTGYIPAWMGYLHYLNFRSNRFYGPLQICNLTHVRILDISRNNLSGKIPDCFTNFTSLADKNTTNVRKFFGYRYVIGDDSKYRHWVFRKEYGEYSSVQWKGQESEYKKTLDLLKLIDFSSNRLTGNIPESLSSMRGLISLNLSRNNLTGNIIPDIGQMEMLECLDLSKNQLSGEIPTSFQQLHFLDFLDLSNNNLSGKIPTSTQLQSFNISSYDGNNGLCGHPLTLCPEDILRPSTQGEIMNENDAGFWRLSIMQEFGISMAFGFILGFWGVVASFVLKRSWRIAYFNFLDAAGDRLHEMTSIFLSKLRRG